MVKNWDFYSRQSLDLASSAANLGFSAAKFGTRCGFALTRGIVSTAVGVTSSVVDHALFGGNNVARQALGDAAHSVISFAERVTLAPIFLGEYVTATSVIAAHSSINVLSVFFPGSSDASFSLASFITLVKREWSTPAAHGPGLSDKEYGITQIARGIIAWVSLQGVTQEWQEKMWFKHVREIRVHEPSETSVRTLSRKNSRVRVTSDVIFPDRSAHIIAADIGEAPPRTPRTPSLHHPYSPTHSRQQSVIQPSISRKDRKKFTMTPLTSSTTSTMTASSRPVSTYSSYFSFPPTPPPDLIKMPTNELKATLRRLSKLVLAGYGGATLWFFGIASPSRTPSNSAAAMASEEAELANAIVASEAEASGEGSTSDLPSQSGENGYSWWSLLLGKHDQELFERAHQTDNSSDRSREKAKKELRQKMKAKSTAVIGSEHLLPRFWVLTDHGRAQVVLVMRGTMSLNEIAADLTCESEPFEPVSEEQVEPESQIPGQFAFPSMSQSHPPTPGAAGPQPKYHVHAGMLRMAKAMGTKGKPVQLAVQEALYNNPDYELVMCGHSLGAGVAAILAMMWADPKTCLTVRSSGLPAGRRVSAYLIGPPALTDAALGKLASNLMVSFVYSHDVIARLSLGSVRDLRNAAAWLCEAERKKQEGVIREGYTAVTDRARRWKDGFGSVDDPKWFIAMRKSLEANMQSSNMFPPGRVLWAVRDSDLHHNHRSAFSMEPGTGTGSGHYDKLRLFEVHDVEKVFGQIVFAKHMLTAHFPNEYDKALHDLL